MTTPDDEKTIVLGAAASPSPPPRATRGGSANALPIGTQLSEFEIVGLVGEGGFGIVYLADDHSLQRRVAIKEYMPSSLAMRGSDASVVVRSERHTDTFETGLRSFVNEARLLAQFDHPALLKVYRFWEANGTAYMAMPYYAGQTLRDALRERQGPPPDEAWICKILAPVMDALELMHAENCYHRDVAPDNIMLLRDERPVLLDFGAARRVISDMTQALTVILKPGYAPIEQYAEMPGVKQGPWTDIYALAAVVYFTITGRTPPPAVGRMLQDGYEPLTQLAAGRYNMQFLNGIDQCLRVKGEERPQSIAEMRALLGMSHNAPSGAIASPHEASMVRTEEAQPYDTVMLTDFPASTHVSRILPQAAPAAEPAAALSSPPSPPPAPAKKPAIPLYAAALAAAGVVVLGAFLFMRGSAPEQPTPSQPSAAPREAAPSVAQPTPPAAPSAPVAAPAPSTPAVAAGPVTLDNAFSATVAASDARFELKVNKVHTPLTIGKDALSFVLHSQRSGLVYVLLWDKATAQLSQIFPNELDRGNRISAGKTMVFPRPDWAYEADPPRGDWDILAIVADSPRDFSALRLDASSHSAAQKQVEAALSESAKGAVGLGGEARCSAGDACSPAFAAARFSVEEVGAPERRDKNPAKAALAQPTDKAPAARLGKPGENAEKQYMKELNQSLDKLLKEN